MPKQIIIAEQHRIAAVFSEDQIQELIVAKGTHQVGDIYLGIVENVLPGIDAAFVNIGDSERNGFIHVTDLGPLRLRKSAGSITELLAPQQKVLVQIMKEPTGNKGPRLTGNISLPGRYLVLMPFGRGVNLSRRIRNEAERNRLRALAILIKPAGMGLLVRTEAEGVAEEAILEDLEALQKQWETIQQEALSLRPPSLLNRDDDFIQKVLRDVYSADVNRIVVDSHTGLKRVKQHLINWSGGRSPQGVLIDHHRDRIPILEYFRVNAAIREALKPRVDLPSGGYIIIERTEALTVIDVNSGSFTRSATARETVLWTNCEAAAEIARQLRLRNIAGVIVVDFIDMDSRRDQLQVLEQFNKALRSDKARPQIAQLSELGLVELTRKRQGQNIYELFGQTCSTCSGIGHLVHLPGEMDHEVSETVEALRSVPAQEPRLPLRETWDRNNPNTEEFDSDGSSDLQELDLTNHPNYQERSRGGDNRRRRRSRLKVNEPALKGGLPKVDLDAEEETPAEEPVYSVSPIRIPKESRGEKPERGRSARREKQPVDPPQVVAVEMTPEEQDVYALMGISPLVLTAEPVKDPKSTVIAVTTPGEPSALPQPVRQPIPRRSEADFSSPSMDALQDTPQVDAPEDNAPEVDVPEEEVTSSPVDEVELAQAELEAPFETGSNGMEVGVDPSRRRRRRRSSTGVSGER
jgi:ribonuclease E